jgi:hypothetical protein
MNCIRAGDRTAAGLGQRCDFRREQHRRARVAYPQDAVALEAGLNRGYDSRIDQGLLNVSASAGVFLDAGDATRTKPESPG